MSETMTETPQTPTDGAGSSEASPTNLLSSESTGDTPQQGGEPAQDPKPAEGDKPAEAKVEGAPENYTFTAPEGHTYDSAVIDSFSAAAKEANLSQDAAQKLLETMAPKLATTQQAALDKAIATTRESWAEATRTDAEFGGDKLPANMALAKKALDFVAPKNADGTPSAFAKLLDDTGLCNRVEVLQALAKFGKAISEDTFVGGLATARPRDIGAILYNNTPQQA